MGSGLRTELFSTGPRYLFCKDIIRGLKRPRTGQILCLLPLSFCQRGRFHGLRIRCGSPKNCKMHKGECSLFVHELTHKYHYLLSVLSGHIGCQCDDSVLWGSKAQGKWEECELCGRNVLSDQVIRWIHRLGWEGNGKHNGNLAVIGENTSCFLTGWG